MTTNRMERVAESYWMHSSQVMLHLSVLSSMIDELLPLISEDSVIMLATTS